MGKEQDLLKAVKEKDMKKIQKLLTSSSMKRKNEDTVWQNVDTGHKIRKLLSHIDVNTKDPESGCTPLLLAVLGGMHDMVEILIFYSANVRAQDDKGNSALHLAVFGSRPDLLSLLLANDADVNCMNADLNTPLHLACQHNVKGPIVTKLVEAGANVWLKNKDKHTPLDIAAMYNKKEAVSILMEYCPSLKSNKDALVEAAMRDNVDVLELLLEYGMDPNQPDILRASTALHEAVRFCRMKAAELLLAFGADADVKNMKDETARGLSKDLPAAVQERFESLFQEYKDHHPRIPKFMAQRDSLMSDSFKLKCLKSYPMLPTQKTWTQNTKEFCSSCTESNNNRHVVDDNASTFWVIPECHDAWTILDLGYPHIITGITIVGWDSPQMVKTFELQASDYLQGPWTTFSAATCKRAGSSNPRDPGTEQTFKGFTVKVQFLRFYVVDNHGGSSINFQGIRLHGADCRIFNFLKQYDKKQLADTFIESGINYYSKLIETTDTEISAIVEDPVEVYELYQAIQEERRKWYPMTMLKWLTPPVKSCTTADDVPNFSVQSDPSITEEVEVKIDGAEVAGTLCVRLQPTGENSPSVAVFQGLRIKTAGKFLIRVQGVSNKLSLDAEEQIEIRPGRKNSSEIGAAFDEIEEMLRSIQDTL